MATPPPKEKTVQRNILNYLNGLDRCRARSHTAAGPYNQAGEPDIDAVWDGRALKIEVKRAISKKAPPLHDFTEQAFRSRGATELQARTLYEWRQAGAIVAVVSTVEQVKLLLDLYRGD